MATDNRCSAVNSSQRPEGRGQRRPTGPEFGCVDWFLYDNGAFAAATGEQCGVPEFRSEIGAAAMTASEERQLMGYVH